MFIPSTSSIASASSTAAPVCADAVQPAPALPRRSGYYRDCGAGYGRSSGYARQERYTSTGFPARFRLG